MNSKNWNDRADKDLFFTILSVKNIGVISGSEWTTIGNHMRSLGYGFTNEGCRQHFQGLRRAQNKAETAGPNGDIVRRNDPTMNPITRRPGPGRGRPRKQPPVPVPGAGEIPTDQPMPVGIAPGPNPVPPYPHPHPHPHPQAVQSYGVPPGNHQAGAHLPAQPAAQPGNISPAIPTQQVPPPSNVPHVQGPITYPSPPRAPDTSQAPAHLHPLQHAQSGQPGQQPQPEQQPPPAQQLQSEFEPQPDQQDGPEQAPQPSAETQPEQENSIEYHSQDVSQEAPREAREATNASAASQHAPVEQNDDNSQAALTSEPLQHSNEDIDADGDADGDADADADGEADIDNDEPAAKRPRLSSPEPPKDTDMDDEAVLALAAHNGSTDFASDFATYGEA
ncbi:hypothetical protein FMUND_14122 [Fusarium mundagurra]|uniref:Myb-like domain-containing protein n=1 Tax=Fusarium mundagurra TaxID=1567541 RepID=A0A8H5XW83_9HYPO|nr:hypothetical protein FMUND_14122 [Fusarium mundagurra]